MLAIRWIFATKKIASENDIDYTSSTGANFLKGDIGGLLLSGSLMVPLFLFHSLDWVYPIVLLLASVVFARIISFITEGNSKGGVIALVVELVMIATAYGIYAMST